jgi:hypothetical protein
VAATKALRGSRRVLSMPLTPSSVEGHASKTNPHQGVETQTRNYTHLISGQSKRGANGAPQNTSPPPPPFPSPHTPFDALVPFYF